MSWVIIVLAICYAWLGYVYVGYPMIVLVGSRLFRRCPNIKEITPKTALIISAYNEESVIGAKLENALALDYPEDRLDIWVSSDGSSDNTNAIVRKYAKGCPRIHLAEYAENRGKTAALMDTLRRVDPAVEIIVFSDANGIYSKDAIRKLVRHFADEEVGAVAGELRYVSSGAESRYRTYENWLKRAESDLGSCLVAEGSIFAARRELIPNVDPTFIEDLVIPLHIALRGYRVIYEPSAVSEERFELDWKGQYRRRRRIVNRSIRSLQAVPGAINPIAGGTVAIRFISHRVMRWLSPIFFFTAISLGFLTLMIRSAAAVFGLVSLIYSIAVVAGLLLDRRYGRSIFTVPYYFLLNNLAILSGLMSVLLGSKIVRWVPER